MGLLTYQTIKNTLPSEQLQTLNCGTGNSLFLIISKIKQGGTKNFVGKTRFPPTKDGKQIPVYLYSFGNDVGQTKSVRYANEKWVTIRKWSKETGRDPRHFEKRDHGDETLKDAFESWFKRKSKKVTEGYMNENRKKFENTICKFIDPNTPLKPNLQLTRDNNNGRTEVVKVIDGILESNPKNDMEDMARRCQNILKWTFGEAERRGWMLPDSDNPAKRIEGDPSPQNIQHYAALAEIEDLPKLLEDICLNRPNAHPSTVLASHFQMMTGLRPQTVVKMQWDWITKKQDINCFKIDGKTEGLKRIKGKTDHIEHYVPITADLKRLLNKIKKYSYGSPYLFPPVKFVNMQGKYPHMTKESVNNYLIRLRYEGNQTAHGYRTLMLTHGQDQLDYDSEIIRRTMGHLLGDKTRKAYDRSLKLKKRTEFCRDYHKFLKQNGLKF